MTAHRDLKKIIRDRQKKTGESYAAARAQIMRDRAALLGLEPSVPATAQRVLVDAAVLKVNRQSARVRVLGEDREVTFRAGGLSELVPGHLVTLVFERRWTWRGDAYASGKIGNPRIDVAALGLDPLPLEGGEPYDVAASTEPYEAPDPYALFWRALTARPRPWFEFDPIAWGALPGRDPDDNPTCDAADLASVGDHDGARDLLMDVLGADLRCLDAHAHLGNLVFERRPERAMIHYEVGIRIGELSLPADFDGLLVWGRLYNRPFLRCLHGYGLCCWRLGQLAEAQRVFERILSLNPSDNQGVRFCWDDVRHGRSWQEVQEREHVAEAAQRQRFN